MRIVTRLTLLFLLLTLLVAFTVGWFAVAMSSRAQYATLDSSINSVVDSGLRNPNEALSDALYVVQRDSYDLTLDVVYPRGQISQVNSASVPLVRVPTLADVKSSLDSVTSENNLPGFEIRSLYIGGDDYLVVAGSTSGISKENQHLALLVVVASAVIALIGLILARVVIRRDLRLMERLIDYAGGVAGGDEDGPVPPSEGNRDLRELQAALVVMVDSLRERIALETRTTKAMQQFIDDASHELRTPLTVVKGYNDLLAQGDVSPEQQSRALTRMAHEVERMEALVRDLLLLAEVREAPRRNEEVLNASVLLETKVSDFARENPSRPFSWSIQPGVVLRIRTDFVERLVDNALSNVLRYTPADAPLRITLSSRGERATLVIADGGAGLPVYGERPQRFQRFDDSRSRDTGGSGLGMSIMADIAESVGGSMTTERSALGGLALRFEIPVAVL